MPSYPGDFLFFRFLVICNISLLLTSLIRVFSLILVLLLKSGFSSSSVIILNGGLNTLSKCSAKALALSKSCLAHLSFVFLLVACESEDVYIFS